MKQILENCRGSSNKILRKLRVKFGKSFSCWVMFHGNLGKKNFNLE